ncbi:hypothetical protein CPHO_00330 [Corynebacterium phocae]|uniref:Uncharacterized protein n=1 Tax=Corynebacterium phocae TaxID=161895 RepID=A0A1L7D0S1_9CORY|nr:hypothetical protein CPHO_00330 [Corynebacterium phocae]
MVTSDVGLPLACNVQLNNSLAGGYSGVYNSQEEDYRQFRVDLKVQAPETVEFGQTFEYAILPTNFSLPAKISSASISKADQINLWVDLPENAQVLKVEAEEDPASIFEVKEENGRIHLTGAPSTSPADVTRWDVKNKNQWKSGGLAAKNSGGELVLKTPKITISLKSKGLVGETIQPKIRRIDPKTFSNLSFVQVYAEADAPIVGTIPAFIRCGLSQDDESRKAEGKEVLEADTFPAVKVVAKQQVPTPGQQTVATSVQINLLEADGTAFAAGSMVELLINGQKRSLTVEDSGVARFSVDLENGQETNVNVGFADNLDNSVDVSVTGGKEGASATLQRKPLYPAVARVQLTDANGKPLEAGKDVQLLVGGEQAAYTVGADGYVDISVSLRDSETKLVKVAFADQPSSFISVELKGGKDVAPVLHDSPLARTQNIPDPTGSSGPLNMDNPIVWGSILATALGLPVIGMLIKIAIDYFKIPLPYIEIRHPE